MALHLTQEFRDGCLVGALGNPDKNPYNYFDEYEKFYAWDIGHQKGKNGKFTMGGN